MFAMELAAVTDHGLVRKAMDDDARVNPRLSLALVAEGRGSAPDMTGASELAIDAFEAAFSRLGGPGTRAATVARMIAAAQHAHERIRGSQDDLASRGCAGVALMAIAFAPDAAIVVQIGSTRGFRVRAGRITPLTDLPVDTRAAGEPLGVGAGIDLATPVFTSDLELGDVFVVCSDGVWRSLSPARLATEATHAENARDACGRIVGAAWAIGGLDNVAVAVVRLVPNTLRLPDPSFAVFPESSDAEGASA